MYHPRIEHSNGPGPERCGDGGSDICWLASTLDLDEVMEHASAAQGIPIQGFGRQALRS